MVCLLHCLDISCDEILASLMPPSWTWLGNSHRSQGARAIGATCQQWPCCQCSTVCWHSLKTSEHRTWEAGPLFPWIQIQDTGPSPASQSLRHQRLTLQSLDVDSPHPPTTPQPLILISPPLPHLSKLLSQQLLCETTCLKDSLSQQAAWLNNNLISHTNIIIPYSLQSIIYSRVVAHAFL